MLAFEGKLTRESPTLAIVVASLSIQAGPVLASPITTYDLNPQVFGKL